MQPVRNPDVGEYVEDEREREEGGVEPAVAVVESHEKAEERRKLGGAENRDEGRVLVRVFAQPLLNREGDGEVKERNGNEEERKLR